ncbi:MAG TPA: hypothetical protein VFC07_10975, partial [Verrucomicrobiae bacterium]|nr:hypothetical protein [Verrucomicrobiae bacterium]
QTGATSYHGDDEVLADLIGEPAYSRWGDYNAISVDPSDPKRFWSIIMYPSDDQNSDVYSTQITELIVAGPPLVIAQTGANVNVSWPAPATGYVLQSSTNPAASVSWTNVTQTPATNGGQISVLLPISTRQQSFRLKK